MTSSLSLTSRYFQITGEGFERQVQVSPSAAYYPGMTQGGIAATIAVTAGQDLGLGGPQDVYTCSLSQPLPSDAKHLIALHESNSGGSKLGIARGFGEKLLLTMTAQRVTDPQPPPEAPDTSILQGVRQRWSAMPDDLVASQANIHGLHLMGQGETENISMARMVLTAETGNGLLEQLMVIDELVAWLVYQMTNGGLMVTTEFIWQAFRKTTPKEPLTIVSVRPPADRIKLRANSHWFRGVEAFVLDREGQVTGKAVLKVTVPDETVGQDPGQGFDEEPAFRPRPDEVPGLIRAGLRKMIDRNSSDPLDRARLAQLVHILEWHERNGSDILQDNTLRQAVVAQIAQQLS